MVTGSGRKREVVGRGNERKREDEETGNGRKREGVEIEREYIRETDCLCVAWTRMTYVCDCTMYIYGGGSDLMRNLVTGLCGVNIDRWPLSY